MRVSRLPEYLPVVVHELCLLVLSGLVNESVPVLQQVQGWLLVLGGVYPDNSTVLVPCSSPQAQGAPGVLPGAHTRVCVHLVCVRKCWCIVGKSSMTFELHLPIVMSAVRLSSVCLWLELVFVCVCMCARLCVCPVCVKQKALPSRSCP